MIVAVRPPEYFPVQSYVALALHADRLVLADTFRYSSRSNQNRARLRTPQGWHWVSIPLKGGQSNLAICDVEVENRERWLIKHWRSFQYNYRSTPYFEFYEPQLEPFFEQTWKRLGDVTCASIELIMQLLDLSNVVARASDMRGKPDSVEAVADLISGDAGVTLLTTPGSARRDAKGIDSLQILDYTESIYEQNFDGFERGMSAVDLIFNYGPDAVQMMRDGSRLEAASV